jgi:hypothetical protein
VDLWKAGSFLAESWHFELIFEADDGGGVCRLKIAGKDVDYLAPADKAVG